MSRRMTGRVALALAAIAACAVVASLAIAQETSSSSAAEQAALDKFCPDPDPCVIVNGSADPAATGDDPQLTTVGAALAASGKPPSACPAARDGYRAAGIEPDAFVGPCPRSVPGPKVAEAARANAEAAIAVRGGAR